ncbi:hypothetical protein B5G06_10025 [Flavonifractor sp. An52]|uniref:S-layer homology domain-containing protein n=1 Tax=Flavonifractor sp. An52 TaxID=1965642 RepID=UPI000B3AE4EF|nr:S-layer homology domain-containing protein [Flavonifractor sp. An52]OUN81967.1 hypothetical protein B5G06_10025 [Flavonifractor sp. An52]
MKRRSFRLLSCLCVLAMAISMLPAAWAAEPTPLKSTIAGGTYNGNWAVPIDAYLYQDGDNLVRVENFKGVKIVDAQGNFMKWSAYPRLVAETYDSNFQLISSVDLDMELDLWGGFYAGEDYNFVIFGQENPSEDDNAEVIRVVKYDKDWNRLGQASLRGANTTIPFDAGSLRCDEYNGYLYVRTSHEMYQSGDGLNHQANLTFSVRESDMTITDGYHDVVANKGYVSHSFNQFILVDSQGRLVALDHGDAYPRGACLSIYDNKAGSDTFANGCKTFNLTTWSGRVGENTTGANVTDLAETSSGYLVAYSSTGKGSASTIGQDPMNIFLSYTSKDDVSSNGTTVRQLTSWPSDSELYGSQPVLVPTGPDGGYILWQLAEKWDNGYYYNKESIQYATYSADGTVSNIRTADGVQMSRCHPISYNGKVVWYSTHDSTPVFYVLDESGVQSYPVGEGGGQQPDPDPDPNPYPDPDPTPDPGDGENGDFSFSDVPASQWYADYAVKAAQAGLMKGTGGDKFSPNGTLTVAEVVTLTARLYADRQGESVPISDGAWYLGAYNYCVDQGLFTTSEVPLSTMLNKATRFQMVDLLDRAVPEEEKEVIKVVFNGEVPDVQETDPYGPVVYLWYRAGIVEGDNNGSFHGNTNISRAETAAILCRLAGLTPRV